MQATKMKTVILALVFFAASATGVCVLADELPNYHHVCLDMANGAFYDDSGVSGRDCDPVAYEQYYHKHDGGGLNEIHLTTDVLQPNGDIYVSDEQSGTFYVTNTGGARGYVDEAILLVSINADAVAPNLKLRIQSSGYEIVTNSLQQIVSYTYVPDALDQTFTAQDFTDFAYGPQTWKPSGSALYPLWFGQDVSDPSTASLLLFVDLNVASVKSGKIPGATNDGAARVDFTFTGLTDLAAFNVYGFTFYSSQGQGISWTNQTSGDGSSGMTINPPPAWGAAEAQASSGSAMGTSGSEMANILFMFMLPVGLVTSWKLSSWFFLRTRRARTTREL